MSKEYKIIYNKEHYVETCPESEVVSIEWLKEHGFEDFIVEISELNKNEYWFYKFEPLEPHFIKKGQLTDDTIKGFLLMDEYSCCIYVI